MTREEFKEKHGTEALKSAEVLMPERGSYEDMGRLVLLDILSSLGDDYVFSVDYEKQQGHENGIIRVYQKTNPADVAIVTFSPVVGVKYSDLYEMFRILIKRK